MAQTPLGDETPLQDRKLALEVEKLQTEIDVLRRPSRHPQLRGSVFTALAGVLAGISVAGVQYCRSNQDYVLAQIKTERLALEAERLEKRRSALEAVSKGLARENEIRRAALASVEAEFRGVQERLASTKLTRDQLNGEVRLLREAVTRAKNATLRVPPTVENQPAMASMTVVNTEGTPLKSGDTVFLGDRLTLEPSVTPAAMIKATPTRPK